MKNVDLLTAYVFCALVFQLNVFILISR